jgi:predicted RNase H-like HicB family nuclease
MEYVLIIHRAEEGGYWAEVPALPGCFAQGETLDELYEDARGAIASHLEALRAEGQQPEETFIGTVRLQPTAA